LLEEVLEPSRASPWQPKWTEAKQKPSVFESPTSCDESKARQLWSLVIQGDQKDSRI